MRELWKYMFLVVATVSFAGCGGSVSEEGAVIPEEDQPTSEELDADIPLPEEGQ